MLQLALLLLLRSILQIVCPSRLPLGDTESSQCCQFYHRPAFPSAEVSFSNAEWAAHCYSASPGWGLRVPHHRGCTSPGWGLCPPCPTSLRLYVLGMGTLCPPCLMSHGWVSPGWGLRVLHVPCHMAGRPQHVGSVSSMSHTTAAGRPHSGTLQRHEHTGQGPLKNQGGGCLGDAVG